MKKTIRCATLVGLCTLLSSTLLFGQTISGGEDDSKLPDLYRFGVQMSLVHWLTPDLPSLHFEGDYRVGEKDYIRLGYGYMLPYTAVNETSEVTGLDGYRLRLGYRRFFKRDPRSIRYQYFGASVDYRDVTIEQEGEFLVEPTLLQRLNLPYTAFEESVAGNVQWGFLVLGERFHIDIGVGVGARRIDQSYSTLPEGLKQATDGRFFRRGVRWEYDTDDVSGWMITGQLNCSVGVHW